MFARRMKAYRNEYKVPESAFAHVSVKAYENANLNPLAHMHDAKMTFDRAATANDKNPNFLVCFDHSSVLFRSFAMRLDES